MAQTLADYIEGAKKDLYGYVYEARDQEPFVHPLIFKTRRLDAAWEQWTMIVEEAEPTEKTAELADAPVRDTIEGFTIYMRVRNFHTAKKWSKLVTRNIPKLADLVAESVRSVGRAFHSRKERFYAGFFNYGGLLAGRDDTFDNSISGNVTDPSGDGVYDGTAASVIPFFNQTGAPTRTSKGTAAYYNAIVGALNEGNLETALILLEYTNAKNERDLEFSQSADTLLVIPHQEKNARKLIESTGGVQDVHSGIINPYQNRLKVLVWRFLTDTDAWFIGIAKRGLVMGEGWEPETNIFEDQRSGAVEAIVDEAYGGTVEDFRPWVGSNVNTT